MDYTVAIIGGGVVGSATAYYLSKNGVKSVILEKETDIAAATTKANSGIVHAGYDPKNGTLMARLNVEGNTLTAKLCEELNVPCKKTGSLVLAFNGEDDKTLRNIYENGIRNGVLGLELLAREQTLKMEPEASKLVTGALYAPSAFVVGPWELCIAMADTAIKNGTKLLKCFEVSDIRAEDDGFSITARDGRQISAEYVVNAAGVNSGLVHSLIGGDDFGIRPNKGQYYLLDKSEGARVNSVIFQCPTKEGKGILVAPTAHGNLIVGPNSEDADFGDLSTTADGLFYVRERSKKSVPNINFGENIRNFSGLRAVSQKVDDFIIEPSDRNARFINVAGIKSPGLSSAPAIGKMVVELLSDAGLKKSPVSDFKLCPRPPKVTELSFSEINLKVEENPAYGKIICRCESVTEGEIIDAVLSPSGASTIDAVKRRCSAGLGRCQGGFCSGKIHFIISKYAKIPYEKVYKEADGSYIIRGATRGGKTHE